MNFIPRSWQVFVNAAMTTWHLTMFMTRLHPTLFPSISIGEERHLHSGSGGKNCLQSPSKTRIAQLKGK